MQGCLTFFLSGCSDLVCSKGCVSLSQFLNDFVVGIDVSSEFSIVAMLAPTGELIRKPFRIDHNPVGFHKLLDILKKEEERLKPLFFFFENIEQFMKTHRIVIDPKRFTDEFTGWCQHCNNREFGGNIDSYHEIVKKLGHGNTTFQTKLIRAST